MKRWRVACATPGLHCQEYPLEASTPDEAARIAEVHTDTRRHVSVIREVTTVEVLRLDPR